jgi:signal transduction histidine kinase/ligand-binding sensor domain-containing protein
VEGNGVRCYGKADGIPVKYGTGLARDGEGNLWFGSSALCRWRPGSARTFLNDISKRRDAGEGVIDVAAGPDGAIWASTDTIAPGMGVFSSTGGKWGTYVVPGFDGSKVAANALFIDHENTLWIGTDHDGVYRVHDGIAEHFGSSEGLSGNYISFVYEDREGNVWITTDGGIDMFRDAKVVSYSRREGLSETQIKSVLALQDGSLWIGNGNVIDILDKNGRHSVLPAEGRFDQGVTSLFQDRKGALWVARGTDLFAYDHRRFLQYKRSDASNVDKREIAAITQDAVGNIWVLTSSHVLFQVQGNSVVPILKVSNDNRILASIAPDHEGGLWISSGNDVLTYYKNGSTRTISMNKPDSSFSISEVSVDADDALLVATNQGLFHWDGKSWHILAARNGLPGDVVISVLRDNDNAVWVRCKKGLVRISEREFDKWRRQNDDKPVMEVFDRLDGARPEGSKYSTQPSATKTPDGRLWFVASSVVQMIDPRRTFRNPIPPPVHIESLVADHKEYGFSDNVRLPALSRDIEIDYTALSFVVPQRVRFRYKLEGRDTEWQDGGTRRSAFYTNLRPQTYKFLVMACNNSGLWNEEGASLAFTIAPAWYQTGISRVSSLLTGLLFLWLIYYLRMKQASRAIRALFDERMAERTRLARDLHDTLLQTLQGSKLVADEALEHRSDAEYTGRSLEKLSEWIDQAMGEGRAALNALHASAFDTRVLSQRLQSALDECQPNGVSERLLTVSGTPVEMNSIITDEICRVGYEAIRNAFMHSRGTRIEVQLAYSEDFTLIVRDNGRGMDSATASRGRDAHFGLQGMRERAARIHGQFQVITAPNLGTTIELKIGGKTAFGRDTSAWSKLLYWMRGTRGPEL